MTTYVLVHGAWMGQFAWELVAPRLEEAGHRVITLDLPGHGDDQADPAGISLDSYRAAVLAALGDSGDVVLVGHSMGGMVISAVAEAAPERLRQLVYVSAYLPRDGESLYGLSQEDSGSKVGQYWRQEDPARYSPAWIDAAGIVPVFAADCPQRYQNLLVARHRPEPLAPLATPVRLSAERYGRVPRAYIETLLDACVSHQLQTLMLERTPVERRFQLQSAHSPFFAVPDQLAACLLECA